ACAQLVGSGMVAAEPIRVPGDVQDDRPVQEPVQKRRGDHIVAEHLAPGGDGPVGGQDDRGLQVPLGDDLEQRGGGLGRQGQVAQFVDHEERGAGVEPHGGGPPALDGGAVAAGGQVGGGGEVGAV